MTFKKSPVRHQNDEWAMLIRRANGEGGRIDGADAIRIVAILNRLHTTAPAAAARSTLAPLRERELNLFENAPKRIGGLLYGFHLDSSGAFRCHTHGHGDVVRLIDGEQAAALLDWLAGDLTPYDPVNDAETPRSPVLPGHPMVTYGSQPRWVRYSDGAAWHVLARWQRVAPTLDPACIVPSKTVGE